MLVNGHYLFRERTLTVRKARGKDNVQWQISGRILRQMQSIVFIILQPFTQNAVSKIWGYYTDTPQLLLGNIQSRNAFRSIASQNIWCIIMNAMRLISLIFTSLIFKTTLHKRRSKSHNIMSKSYYIPYSTTEQQNAVWFGSVVKNQTRRASKASKRSKVEYYRFCLCGWSSRFRDI